MNPPYRVFLVPVASPRVAGHPREGHAEGGGFGGDVVGGVGGGALHQQLGARDDRQDFVPDLALVEGVVALEQRLDGEVAPLDVRALPRKVLSIPLQMKVRR